MKNLYRLWYGELSLENAFWNWAVIGGVIINGASSGLFLILITADYPISALLIGYVFSVPYNFVVAVGVWRSADQFTGERHLADLARILTVVSMVLLSVT